MVKWAFVSDFDGTISLQDFYWMVIENYYPEGEKRFREWKSGEIKDIEFLSDVFSSINQDEETIINSIHRMAIDQDVPEFIKEIQNNGGDFYILSAGSDYYIQHILEKHGVRNVKVYANRGYYKNRNVHMITDESDWHYHERYGIDKSRVVKHLKQEYDRVYFAGDSEPDSHPAAYADVTFAKDALQTILSDKGLDYVPVNSFAQIRNYLINEGSI
ncbi:2,3-diketo-5-methylthio-1-phosphopentane phosphatase [Alteribacter lacisalsi]|uniref:2,3-diketo-5-methylthio-1-phosphopentane phosphatase n=1 Tax=Alteribacter lacisalsi TaxID=2045244 RepID=A0A2W0HMF7_9BACI|nr:MtnX-like HAD-IB family phosphatase [Alteribacter lacisalsi]PYZ98252.1 2,3-diketo-5-methylthio-1-phosphopentane phosphatase [Alteribacter lacisalsi]